MEIVRVSETMNELHDSLDYELHRLTEWSPEFFDETVGRHFESLDRELAALQSEAEALAVELEELTGGGWGGGRFGSKSQPRWRRNEGISISFA